MKQYGQFNKEADGRFSGHVMYVSPARKDGRIPVQHHFGSGKRINKLYTADQLAMQLEKFQAK